MSITNRSLSDDAMVAVHPNRRMTEEEFVAWCPEKLRAEWVEGEVLMMSPVNLEHDAIVRWLGFVLEAYVARHRLGRVFGGEVSLRLATKQRRLPDLTFVAAGRVSQLRAAHIEGPADLVIEVVCPESHQRDYKEKFRAYEAGGVAEYWLVEPLTRSLLAYSRDDSGKYQPIDLIDGKLPSQAVPGFYVRPEWLWPDTQADRFEVLRELGVIA